MAIKFDISALVYDFLQLLQRFFFLKSNFHYLYFSVSSLDLVTNI